MTTTHRLKTEAWSFDAVARGEKPFEIRFNDRGYQKGDIVELERLRPDTKTIDSTADILTRRISFVTHYEQKDGWCVFGMERP